jgi:hypothetical protein
MKAKRRKRPQRPRAKAANATPRNGWFRSLSKGVKWLVAAVITAGALATAIGGIVALWPDPPSPVEELRAEISSVTVDAPVTLDEYQARREAESDAGEKSSAPAPRRPAPRASLAAVTLPRSPVETAPGVAPTRSPSITTPPATTAPITTAPITTAPATTAPPTTTPPAATTTPAPPTTAPPVMTTPTTTDPEDDDEGLVVKVRLGDQARTRMHEGVRQALESPGVDQTDIGDACSTDLTDPDCGLSSLGVSLRLVGKDGTSAPDPDPLLAEQLTKILTGIRTESLPSGQSQPVGVTVNYKITLTGFRGRIAVVRWALHSRAGTVPRPWLGSQVASRLKAEAENDTATPQIWVPLLPKDEGPFFVRLEVFNDLGERLDFRDTPDFR